MVVLACLPVSFGDGLHEMVAAYDGCICMFGFMSLATLATSRVRSMASGTDWTKFVSKDEAPYLLGSPSTAQPSDPVAHLAPHPGDGVNNWPMLSEGKPSARDWLLYGRCAPRHCFPCIVS